MNRAIKFRGKVLHRKSHQKNEWVYGMPTIFRDGRTAIRWQCSEKAKDPEAWKTQSVEPETLGQFTGVYDRNGKEIYEGDILMLGSSDAGICEVKWNELQSSFCVRFYYERNLGIRPFGAWARDGEDIAILGNIHDNPELLNEK